jgi:hypothetical protein
VALTDPAVLKALEHGGFALGRLLEGVEATSTAELNRQPGVKTIFDVVRNDVIATNVADRRAKVTSVDGFRLFESRWLDSKDMSLRLIGVFNRLDRRAFHRGTCGEIRFVYRLAYEVSQGGAMASRLRLPGLFARAPVVGRVRSEARVRDWAPEL